MATLTLSLKHAPLNREESCAVCRARFTPSEDSGSRLLSIAGLGQEPFRMLMCGGCYSKWSHGTTVAVTLDPAPRSESLAP